jgi:putative ribosome biogenesis GTPase RsgA
MSETNAEEITRAINACCGDPADCSHYEEGTCPNKSDSEEQRVDTEAMEQIRTLWDL